MYVTGGLVILSILIGICYFVYRKKSKGQQAGSGGRGIMGRFGFRTQTNPVQVVQQPNRRQGGGLLSYIIKYLSMVGLNLILFGLLLNTI